jgi:hypothetical protein
VVHVVVVVVSFASSTERVESTFHVQTFHLRNSLDCSMSTVKKIAKRKKFITKTKTLDDMKLESSIRPHEGERLKVEWDFVEFEEKFWFSN